MSENFSLKAFVVIMKASRTLEEITKKDIKKHGMRTSDFTILEALYHKGKQTIREISEAVLINTGSITYVIDKLENNGLLTRSSNPDDRRAVYIEITDKGKEIMDDIFPKHQRVIEELFDGISEEEKQTVIDVLKKVGTKNMGEINERK
ncbi:MarR family transcriptional regulator [Oceanobacillus kimchii]|uniref:MarR family transcriptional regulator n=1 Tax=Oceanobacillus kimchii TaxID=746691 RepID=A0ABQ5TDJ5_9BACI|nr:MULTISPECIES: MarR family transcriptional regulator [Oceanobacillus]MCT1577512.1 MarR family transcriptional regulator [Oceanobacillus kimchii]MCT2137120.1 MarR family transcriptional regulator [Oceanobacillus kimchii]OEH53697.1 transcriptional regulator [Oceanobacillus sp. E9]GLO64776.1 MarR family transcriptional regulator [Oceanobacillus kimchii]